MSGAQNTPLESRKSQRLAGVSRSGDTQRAAGNSESLKRRLTLLLKPAQTKSPILYGSGGPVTPSVATSGLFAETAQPGLSTPFCFQGYTPSNSLQSSLSGLVRKPDPVQKADPRPLRDKNYQSLILKEIYDFCIVNRLDLEMAHPITRKKLMQPTQKDFVLLFQFLYGKIDPNHKFTRSVESEVFIILKSLGYPYLDGINRSSISAAGGQNWPAFLGMLYWLVKINLTMLDLQDDLLISPVDSFDKKYIKCILSSYTAFIEGKEDYSDYYELSKRAYDVATASISVQEDEKRQTNRELLDKFEEINAHLNEVEEAREKSKALESDIKQSTEYMRKATECRAQWKNILDQIESDIAIALLRLDELDAQRTALKDSIHQKGTSIEEIDYINLESEKISRFFDTVSDRIEDVKVISSQMENDVHQSLQSLQNLVNQYNSMTSKIPSKESDGFELLIEPQLVGGGSEGLTVGPEAVLNKLLRTEKIKLLETREKLKHESRRVEDHIIEIKDLVDDVSRQIIFQEDLVHWAEKELERSEDTETEEFDKMQRHSLLSSGSAERYEQLFKKIRMDYVNELIEADARRQELKIKLKDLNYKILREHEQLHEKLAKILQDAVNFISDIQGNVGSLLLSTLEGMLQDVVTLKSNTQGNIKSLVLSMLEKLEADQC